MELIPDAPDIARTLRTGFPSAASSTYLECAVCHEAIRTGEIYYRLMGEDVCESCVRGAREVCAL